MFDASSGAWHLQPVANGGGGGGVKIVKVFVKNVAGTWSVA